jgi:hypothetical protein
MDYALNCKKFGAAIINFHCLSDKLAASRDDFVTARV